MDRRLERILPNVQKPARYTGGELNEIIKDKRGVKLRMAFCFPDVYEIGMSNLGMRILYGVINNEPDEEYYYRSLAEAEHHKNLFLNDDSGLYERIEIINDKQ